MAMKAWKKRMGWTNLARERRLKLEEAARRRAHKAESDACEKRRQKMLQRKKDEDWRRLVASGALDQYFAACDGPLGQSLFVS
jgi:hypothetical protein